MVNRQMKLFLEGTKSMSESYSIHCDSCNANITKQDEKHLYRIRLIEEHKTFSSLPDPDDIKILDRHYNFCNLEHLNQWLDDRC